jgi:hypothetical protein
VARIASRLEIPWKGFLKFFKRMFEASEIPKLMENKVPSPSPHEAVLPA